MKAGVSFKFTDPSIRHPRVNGHATLDEILYHGVRCNLLHEAELDEKIIFEEGNTIGLLEDAILLPAEMLHGMVFAVIGSNYNIDERLQTTRICDFGKQPVDLDILWGDKTKIMALLEQSGPKQHYTN